MPKAISNTQPDRFKMLEPQYDPSGSTLQFAEFSFWADDGSIEYGNVSCEHRQALERYLAKHYGAYDFFYLGPFFVLGCEKDCLPPEDKRPFTVAGLITIWRVEDDMWFLPIAGHHASGPSVQVDAEILAEITWGDNIPDEVILHLANNVFPDCIALTLLWRDLIVELPETSEEDYLSRLETLPAEIERTDYLALENEFYPGVMLNPVKRNDETLSSTTAGVLVEKGQEQRLTSSFHSWKSLHRKYPNQFGEVNEESRHTFKVIQGTEPGTDVGFVRERIEDTDVALVQLDPGIAFENKSIQTAFAPKVFVKHDEQYMGNSYIIDSFATGRQNLTGLGHRSVIKRKDGPPNCGMRTQDGQEHMDPAPKIAYIATQQRVCAANTPLRNEPHVRHGISGAVLQRVAFGRNMIPQKGVMERGEICGMVHFEDVQTICPYDIVNYLVFADVVDPLVEEGWSIVQPGKGRKEHRPSEWVLRVEREKRKADDEHGRHDQNESSIKKRKA
ncbi:hypothetical protein QQX98_006863 [Neonectria punicea]|uniref:Uncharacterized protein n=1 Tax=Neonectria punicea TaxID=979145 RepID=A0ABR1GZL9_9HYPO